MGPPPISLPSHEGGSLARGREKSLGPERRTYARCARHVLGSECPAPGDRASSPRERKKEGKNARGETQVGSGGTSNLGTTSSQHSAPARGSMGTGQKWGVEPPLKSKKRHDRITFSASFLFLMRQEVDLVASRYFADWTKPAL